MTQHSLQATPMRHHGAFLSREHTLRELRRLCAERVARFCHVPVTCVLVRIIPGPVQVDITAKFDPSQLGPEHKLPGPKELEAVLAACQSVAQARLTSLHQTWVGHGR